MCSKMCFDQSGKALYLAETLFPYHRTEQGKIYYQHLGIYAYKRDVLIHLNELAPTPLEISWVTGTIRGVEHGLIVQTGITEYIAYGVDVPEDLYKVENMMKSNKWHIIPGISVKTNEAISPEYYIVFITFYRKYSPVSDRGGLFKLNSLMTLAACSTGIARCFQFMLCRFTHDGHCNDLHARLIICAWAKSSAFCTKT